MLVKIQFHRHNKPLRKAGATYDNRLEPYDSRRERCQRMKSCVGDFGRRERLETSGSDADQSIDCAVYATSVRLSSRLPRYELTQSSNRISWCSSARLAKPSDTTLLRWVWSGLSWTGRSDVGSGGVTLGCWRELRWQTLSSATSRNLGRRD